MKYSVLLHNIRSVHNVGSIFRTADAAGFSTVYLSGYTPSPQDRFGRLRNDLAKVALGAEHTLNWEVYENMDKALIDLKEKRATIVALEQDKNAVDYTQYKVPKDIQELVIVVGEETQGIDTDYLAKMNTILEIPMRGTKESLNVSVAFGVIAYELTRNIK
jgi:tRNA G18 (ribose-2'-O)-methylase SpoU